MTPEESSDNKRAANSASQKKDGKPKNELKRSRGQPRQFWGRRKTQWHDFLGNCVLIGWLWYDLFDSHGRVLKLLFLCVSLAAAHALACAFLFKGICKAVALWFALTILSIVVVWENSRPEPKPHLALSVSVAGKHGIPLLLTNEFLISHFGSERTNIGPNIISACLVVPVPAGATNSALRFFVENDGNAIADLVLVKLAVPDDLWTALSGSWTELQEEYSPEIKYVAYRVPYSVMAGDAAPLPWIDFGTRPTTSVVMFTLLGKDVVPTICMFHIEFLPGAPFGDIALGKYERRNIGGSNAWWLAIRIAKDTNGDFKLIGNGQ